MNSKFRFVLFFIIFFSILAFISWLIALESFNRSFAKQKSNLLKSKEKELDRIKSFSEWQLAKSLLNIEILAENESLKDFIEAQTDAKKKFTNELINLAEKKKCYFQLRFIDTTGKEKIRIDQIAPQKFEAAPEDQLKEKANSLHFIATQNLTSNEVFVSKLDLNIKNGKLEIPFKPTLKYIKPVFSRSGKKAGILVFNRIASDLLNSIPEANFFMLNKEGHILRGGPANLWMSFAFGKEGGFYSLFPKTWAKLKAQSSASWNEDSGNFFYSKFLIPQIDENNKFPSKIIHQDNWKLIAMVPRQEIKELKSKIDKSFFALLANLLALFFPLSLIIAYILNKWLTSKHEKKIISDQLSLISNNIDEAFWVVTNGQITYVNKAIENLLGISAVDYLNGKYYFLDFLAEHDQKFIFDRLHSARHDRRNFKEEVKVWLHDGTSKWIKVKEYDPGLDEEIRIGVIEDLTPTKSLEKELFHVKKMKAIGQFAGGMAHEFNNLLQIMMGYADLLEETADESQASLTKAILKAGSRAQFLIKELMTYSQEEDFRPTQVNIGDILSQVRSTIDEISDKPDQLNINIAEDIPDIYADPKSLSMALINICKNGIEASHGLAKIHVSVKMSQIDENWRYKTDIQEGYFLVISISDSGTGIPEEIVDRIYEPFFSTKEVGKGTGLGLSTAFAIIKRHHGYITVYTEPGHGTSFKVYIPILETPDSKEEIDTEELITTSNEQILLVEDDDMIRNLLESFLASAGYQVISSKEGNDAVEKYKLHFEEIDLLVLDVIVPGKNGAEIYEEAKKITPNVKVVFCSGYSRDLLKAKHLKAHVSEMLSKPFNKKTFLATIRKALDTK